jgi:hypothetical protein
MLNQTIKSNKKKYKIITNGDDTLDLEVKAELIRVIKKNLVLREKLEYILVVHQKKAASKDLTKEIFKYDNGNSSIKNTI